MTTSYSALGSGLRHAACQFSWKLSAFLTKLAME
jgi:hypothetical protein